MCERDFYTLVTNLETYAHNGEFSNGIEQIKRCIAARVHSQSFYKNTHTNSYITHNTIIINLQSLLSQYLRVETLYTNHNSKINASDIKIDVIKTTSDNYLFTIYVKTNGKLKRVDTF